MRAGGEQLGGVSYLFEIDDKGTPQIKKLEGDLTKAMSNIRSQSDRTTSAINTGWGKTKSTLSSGWSSITGSFTRLAASIISVYTAYRLLTGAWNFLKESIAAAAEQEKMTVKLDTALQNAGFQVGVVRGELVKFSDELMRTKGISDEASQSAMAYFVTLGAGVDTTKKAISASADLAAVMGMDFDSAARIMGRALTGKTTALQKMGIVVDETKFKAQGFQAVLDAMSNFMGQAEAQTKTYEGALTRLKLSYGELKETIGFVITSNVDLRAALDTIVDVIWETNYAIDDNKAAYSKLVSEGVYFVMDALNALYKTYYSVRGAMYDVIGTIAELIAWMAKAARAASYLAQAQLTFMNLSAGVRDYFSGFRADMDELSVTMESASDMAGQSATEMYQKVEAGSPILNRIKKQTEETAEALRKMGEAGIAAGAGVRGLASPDEIATGADRGAKEKKKKEEKWEVPTDTAEFMRQFAYYQEQYRNIRSTWKEQEEAFQRLQQMMEQIDQHALTMKQQFTMAWQAIGAGAQNTVERTNNWMQSMADLGSQTASTLQSAFTNTFFNLFQGKIKSMKDIWKNALRDILNIFLQTIAQMIARWIMMKIFSFFGFGFASGGVIPGGFTPIKKFATGGIVDSPTLGLIGEGKGAEAVVPLPDGRSIPVSMKDRQRERPIEITIYNTIDPVNIVSQAVQKAPNTIINPIVADYGNRGQMQKIILRGGK